MKKGVNLIEDQGENWYKMLKNLNNTFWWKRRQTRSNMTNQFFLQKEWVNQIESSKTGVITSGPPYHAQVKEYPPWDSFVEFISLLWHKKYSVTCQTKEPTFPFIITSYLSPMASHSRPQGLGSICAFVHPSTHTFVCLAFLPEWNHLGSWYLA